MNTLATKTTKILFAIALVMTLQACATSKDFRVEYRTEYAGVEQRWDDDYDAKKENVRNIELTNFSVREGYLHFSPRTHYVLQEYDFDRYNEYDRWHYAPKWEYMIVPVIGWFACLLDLENCFGRTTPWSDRPNRIDKNERPTGNVENKSYSGLPYGAVLSGELSGQSEAEELHSQPSTYYRSINIKKIIQSWPYKPNALTAIISAKYQDKTYETVYKLTDTQLASLALESDNWNSPLENKHKYFYQLTSALETGNHLAALLAFKKLEDMEFEKPESFWYRYAQSAKSAGKHELAAIKAEKYLQVAVRRTYEKEATALVSKGK
jgi:hypothetical protein